MVSTSCRLNHALWIIFLGMTTCYFGDATGATTYTPPKMASPDAIVTHEEGSAAILFCSVSNLGDHTVTWRKLPASAPLTIGTKSWTSDRRFHVEHVPNSSDWNLVIEPVQVSDAGDFECQVSKRKSRIRSKVTLLVKARPHALLPRIEISGENQLTSGQFLKLTCNATLMDASIERIIWIKDGKPIYGDHRYSVYTSLTLNAVGSGLVSSKLEIKDVREQDAGLYFCRSTERAQMAGVKVEIRGSQNWKREDKTQSNEALENPENRSSQESENNSSSTSRDWVSQLCLQLLLLYSITFIY
ncbi:lachesin-like [Physella acuta]|uniref:lachesin-like n=1 Tax=Physella acuta TaxID=109671 RepID=UPI0027DB3B41|nr:lachesin-like [Physella acuta]